MSEFRTASMGVDLDDYGLKENPFPLVPGAQVTHWAGMEDVREKLLDIARSVLVTDTGLTEFVIIHGSFGAGKTHALRYLTTLINEREPEAFRSRAIYMPKVKVGSKISFEDLYFQIVQELGADFLSDLATSVEERIDAAEEEVSEEYEREEERRLRDEDPHYFEKEVINEHIPEQDRPMVRLMLALSRGNDTVLDYILEGKPVVEGTGYSQPVDSDYMATQVLSGLFRVMTLPIYGQEPPYFGVHLFIDEMEEVLEEKSSDQRDLWMSIRELVNRLPYNFALLLAFSAEAALLEAVIPTALEDRTSRQTIELQALDLNEAKQFLRDHLASFRPEGFEPPQPFYPFTENAIDYVLEQVVILVPRKIFRTLRQILERSIRREGLEPGSEISDDLAEEIVMQMGL